MILFLRKRPPPEPPPPEPADGKTRNRTGITRIFERALASGEKVTLERAIELLRAGW